MLFEGPKHKHLKCTIYRGEGGGGNATTDSEIALLTSLQLSAQASATSATASASAAAQSAIDADNSADAAALSEAAAALSESNAAASESNAAASEALAEDWATKTTGTVDGVEYSAKYYAQQAATFDPADFVDLVNNQTIGGTKTFSSTISGSIDGNAGSVDGKDFGTFTGAGGVLYATSTTAASGTAAGTAGQVLTSGGAGAPTWTSQSSLSVGSATTATSATTAGNVTGTVAVANGGTGATDAATARSNLGANDASNLTTGTVATARLGSGTANNTTFLRGDQTWATVSTTPTTAQVLTATAGAAVGDVGTYAFCVLAEAAGSPTNAAVSPGTTKAGSALRYASATGAGSGGAGVISTAGVPGSYSANTSAVNASATAISGTWRCMGYLVDGDASTTDKYFGSTLWLRIS